MSDDGHAHEALIIKRHGGGHEEGHHGGVWKIAFADFMTAMMAFFLVMWLISANDKTKATIAKYFNPIELVDSTPQPVGLNDVKKDDPNVQRKGAPPNPDGAPDKEAKPADKAPPAPAAAGNPPAPKTLDISPLDDAQQSAKHDEVELIRDPYAVIEEIATKGSVDPPKQAVPPTAAHPAGGTGAAGLKNGEAFRDPFEPQPVAPTSPFGSVDAVAPTAMALPAPPPAAAGADAATTGASATGAASPPVATPPAGAETAASTGKPDEKPLSPAALKARIAALVKAADAGTGGPKVDVRHTDEGTLISLTDSADFAMFASASARPSTRAVALMTKIGHLLKAQKGDITIRGFTDSRPFKSDTYDNWRLSTERAHIAQYMLMRGDLDETRIDHVEGYADHRPKLPKDPEAPENRRIEILLRNPVP